MVKLSVPSVPFSDKDLLVTKTLLLTGSDPELKRQEIREYFHKTFTLYERIFECLTHERAYYEKAIPLRHPLIFYYGHTAVFFINKLYVAKLIQERLRPELESMLAIGVDEMSWDDLNEQHYNWPSPKQVKLYRDQVRQLVDSFITKAHIKLPITWNDPMWIILMGIEHERIHLETTSVLMRQLPIELVQPHPLFKDCNLVNHSTPTNTLLPVHGQDISLGKSKQDRLYGWDNEYGKHLESVPDFKASQFLVSNHEFLDFVNDGGYQNSEYWTEEGWNWVTYTKATHPEFWVPQTNHAGNHHHHNNNNNNNNNNNQVYLYRTITNLIPMPWSWPVDVNQLEAKAFCNWKAAKTGLSIRLPTEAEWYCLRNHLHTDQPDWTSAPGNINLEHWASACPVDHFKTITPAGDFYDVIGNVWQWTETPINAFPGFQVHPVYDDFSTPTFDGKHNLIKGGSYMSTGNYAIKDSRYAFRRHFFQHAGFRYVEAQSVVNAVTLGSISYESDELVSQYLEFHFGEQYYGVGNFQKQCARICIQHAKQANITCNKALDIGCAVGRTTLELATHFQHVDGLDFSARFISSAAELQHLGIKRFKVKEEGELVSFKEITLDQFGLEHTASRCNFMQADACNLNDKFSGYDLVFGGNLIDRLYSPKQFLSMIHERINDKGILVLASPYTWLEDWTERSEWIGGFKDNTGENLTTLDGLKLILGKHFDLIAQPTDVPFVIRETRRKFQHTISELTVWQKRR